MDEGNKEKKAHPLSSDYKKHLEQIRASAKTTTPLNLLLSYILFIYNIGAFNPFIDIVQVPTRIMLYLLTNESCHPSNLSEMLSLPRPNIAIALKQLEEDKMITRTVDSSDKRQLFISLTPEGKAKAASVMNHLSEMFTTWLDSMTKEQQAALFDIVNSTVDKMIKYYELYDTPFFKDPKKKE